ncbi:universal stress protein [Salinimicrobium terrae]|uniref:universal stress protein n=1 Tax=Salinimicrobium terrae TaxID=470866 RepID=UPI0003FC280A|nr:universal stress protein [Salinimicrobium terrae]
MKVLILSDFSPVAINATIYALDLLHDQQVDFTLLNISVPDSDAEEEEQDKQRRTTQAKLQERVQKLRERSRGRDHKITGHYSEDNLVNAARRFMEKKGADLIVMGAVGEESRHDTILGNHTFEIMSKIKCNILAVPDNQYFQGLKNLLMPMDSSASFNKKSLQFLNSRNIFKETNLSVWEITDHGITLEEERSRTEEIFADLDQVEVDFSTIDKTAIRQKIIWNDVQRHFQLIVLMGKNIRICSDLMDNRHGLFTSVPNRLPILVLHD